MNAAIRNLRLEFSLNGFHGSEQPGVAFLLASMFCEVAHGPVNLLLFNNDVVRGT